MRDNVAQAANVTAMLLNCAHNGVTQVTLDAMIQPLREIYHALYTHQDIQRQYLEDLDVSPHLRRGASAQRS